MSARPVSRKKLRAWTKKDERELGSHSKLPTTAVVKSIKRTAGALRRKAFGLDLSLGHSRHADKRGWDTTLKRAVAKSYDIGRPVNLVLKVSAVPPRGITLVEQDAPSDDTDLEDALKAARERGHLRVAKILDSEEMLSAQEFAEFLGTSRVTVNNKRQKHQILGLEGATRGFRFPKWQVGENGKPFGALPHLFERLGGDAWAVYRFLLQHHPEMEGLTGREALRRGKSKEAIEVAENIARNSA
jgi:hypothetical protein